ncbi:cytochrome P450 [Colletotrichum higginsianum]|nr:cytochrome P450 [Colletotrichum higginsianum]
MAGRVIITLPFGSWLGLSVSRAHYGLSSSILILLPLLLITIAVSRSLYRTISRARLARKLGCRPPPLEPSSLPLGIDIVLASLRADREQRTPDHVAARFAALGAHTFRLSLLGTTNLVTADPRNVQAMLATQFTDFGMGAARSTNLKAVLGRSIFAADGPAWRAAREMMRPLFSRDNLFLGQSTHTLEARLRGDDSHPGTAFNHAFERMLAILGTRMRLRSLYWLYGTAELRSCVRTLHAFVDDAIAASDRARSRGSSLAPYDFLDVLRERCAGGDGEVREQVLGLLAAGRDTTASLMAWAWYCLLRDRRVFAKLRAEVLAAFGSSDPAAVSFASLKQCAYLQHVLSETLRLHSVVPFNSRRALVDTTLPTGGGPDGRSPVFVPAGTEVNFSTHVLHRRRDLWGDDADDFVPERWETKRGAAGAAWHYVPFNGGPRICIGQQLALTEAGYVLVRMLQRYDAVEGLDVDASRDWHNFTVVCSPGSPVDRNEAVLCRLRVAAR